MFYKKIVPLVVLLCSTASGLFAGTLASYSVGDVLLCLRKTGVANDLVVDLGPISTFTNATPNQRINLTQYTGNQLALIGTNGVSWSVFAWFDGTVSPANIQWTLFSSNPRTTPNVPSTPLRQAKPSTQHLVANQMAPIPVGAHDSLTYNAVNSSTAVIEPDNNSSSTYTNGQSYSFSIGPNFNFNDNFGGFPENTTATNFTTSATVQRSDFYWVVPGLSGANGVYLGYFELNTNGMMSYVAYPPAIPDVPVIQAITRTNNIAYIRFTTGASGTYTLRGTNLLASPRTTWPAIASSPGTGAPVTLQDTSSAAAKFYLISAE